MGVPPRARSALVAGMLAAAALAAVDLAPPPARAGGPVHGGSPAVAASITAGAAPAEGGRPAGVLTGPGDHVVRLRHAGIERWAVVHVPAAVGPGPRPTLFHFPGMFETPEMAEESGDLTSYADRTGYLLVIPAHEGIGWRGVPGGEEPSDVDDPGFIRALADLVISRYGADPARLYASGMSNGGLFTQALACQEADRFAAFATVAGSATGFGCLAGAPGAAGGPHPVPMLVIHGAEDQVIRYAQAEAGARAWALAAGCAGPTVDSSLTDLDPGDGTTVVRHDFAGCPAATPVLLYEVVGGGHTWPGGAALYPVEIVGRVSGDLDANAAIWDFVSRFRLPR
ncbi:polyhydroxybutyrate depolymerase [Frankia sp. EI5c]|uniref:alpha/beta hydrolase family esterase n=1 Tax=Frankia sp. EI5c TaxID=683316 RepID=UPI0007C2E32D|nr:prolyl oligopeptidase family serine peptidase [Frankia sp. EI5c]OAA25232.1 polyhydroxybutyrate depolymerase [Frankia sp. EI5c]